MKKLLFGIVLLATFTLRAQTVATNIISIRFTTDGTNANQSLPQGAVQGLWLAYQKNIQSNGTNAPTFPNFVKQECLDRLRALSDEAAADEIATNKVNSIGIPIALWQQLSPAQKTNIVGIFKPLLP